MPGVAETSICEAVSGLCLLMFIALTTCLLVHKREAGGRSEGKPPRPAGCLPRRKPKFLIKMRLPFRQKLTGLSCVSLEPITPIERMLPKGALLFRNSYLVASQEG